MKPRHSVAVTVLSAALLAWGVGPAEAGSICRDGTYSSSTGRGTCSYHGGVLRPATEAEDAAGGVVSEPEPTPTSSPDPPDEVASVPEPTTTTQSASVSRILRIERGLPTRPEVTSGYARTKFRHWITTSGCDTRQWVLIAEAIGGTRSGCTMLGATWSSKYDGVRTSNSSSFDIDHFVPLKEAWDSGANTWSAARREAFANDLGYARSLIAVSASSNRSKSDRDPAEWLPPSGSYRCTYVITWVTVKYRWSLAMDRAEKSAVERVLSACSGTSVQLPSVSSS